MKQIEICDALGRISGKFPADEAEIKALDDYARHMHFKIMGLL